MKLETTLPNGEANQLVRRSTALSLLTLLGVATSFLWDLAIAARFGIGATSDAFYLAYTLPAIFTTLVYLSCYSVLIPAVARRLALGQDEAAWRLFSIVMNMILAIALVIGLAGAITSFWLIRALAPGFSGGTANLAAELSMILFGGLVIAVAFEVVRTGLYGSGRVMVPAAAIVLGNMIVFAFVAAAGPQLGIHSAALGVIGGKALQLCVVVPLLFTVPGFRYHLSLRWRDSDVLDTMRGLLSPMSGMGARQMVAVIERILASTLPAGSITALSFGIRLGTVVRTVFFTSILTALVPALAVHIDRQNLARVRENLFVGVKMVTFVSLPAIVMLVLLREPLAALLFEHGQARAEGVSLTAAVVAIYAVGLLPLGYFRIALNYFYAAESRGVALLLFLLAALANVLLDIVLIQVWGARGIAAASVLSLVVAVTFGFCLMWPRVGGWPWRELRGFAARVGAAGLASMAAILAVQRGWPGTPGLGSDVSTNASYLAVAIGVGILAYLGAFSIMHRQEARRMLELVSRRIRGGGAEKDSLLRARSTDSLDLG